MVHNYVIKNIVLFVTVVAVTTILVIIVHMISYDREALQAKIDGMNKLNQQFSQDAEKVIEDSFSLINILARTSYPEIGIDFAMERQFYDIVDEVNTDAGLRVLLFDSNGLALPGARIGKDVVDDIYAVRNRLFSRGSVLYFGTDDVVYAKALARNVHDISGYLVGLRSKNDMVAILEGAYAKNVSDYYQFAPKVVIKFPEDDFGKAVLDFTYHTPLATGLKTRSLLIIFGVVTAVLGVFTIILRRSLRKPFDDIKRIIVHLSENKKVTYGGALPTDSLFRSIAVALLDMNDERTRYESECRKQEVAARLAGAAAHLAHDMRSPLAVLKGYVQKGPECAGDDDLEYRLAAERSVAKLLHMADDLVDYAKAGKVDRSRPCMLHPIVNQAIAEVRGRTDVSGVLVRCELDESCCANVDAYQLERVLVNLIANAVQACDAGGQVLIMAESTAEGELLLSVRDNGKGIACDDQQKIFESFFTKNKKGGTGLGLAYCKQVVEAHRGTIEVASELGKGTTFTIRIPGCVVPDSGTRAEVNEPPLRCEGRRFVLVDDDADIRLRWRRIVESEGGEVVGEADSYEGVSRCHAAHGSAADVAIVDYVYEGSEKSGIDVITYLKARGIKEIHLCSGHARDEHIRRAALAAGADSVIMKG